MHKRIESTQNAFIKSLLLVQEKSKARRNSGTFLIEGIREITLAQKGGYELETLLICDELFSERTPFGLAENTIKISKEVYQKLAYRDSTEGIIAVAKAKSLQLSDLQLSANPLILVAEGIEKPGNLGAILRTADAANADAVIIADPKTDMYNPNIVRSSVGCLFTRQIAIGNSLDIIQFLKEKNITIFCATLQNSNPYYQENFSAATAIVVGTEATGITDIWRKNSSQNIIIPMQGIIDSMNVSVAAAILLFEAKRQRNFQ